MKWRATVIAGEARPDDGCLVIGGRTVARVYRDRHGPEAGSWLWFWQVIPAAHGRVATKEEAKAACERLAREQLGQA